MEWNLPHDIVQKVKRDFPVSCHETAFDKLMEVKNKEWNVGHNQLMRSLIFLSKGSIEKLYAFFPITDPRDILVEAGSAVYNFKFKFS